jgi:2-dehydro-3-deoxygluconokinase
MSPPRFERLRRARQLDIQVAGAQLNVAANMARLGKNAAFLSKLPDNSLGLLAYDACLSYGVDMSHVRLVSGARMGVNYLDFGATPRVSVTVFDRQGSAASTITPADFDWEAILSGTRAAHTDGIFPALSPGCRDAATIYLTTARAHGCLTTFDVNFRDHLWTADAARACCETLLPLVDVVVTSRSVSELVFGFVGADADILRRYHDVFGCKLVCLTNREIMGILYGAWSSTALYEGQIVQGRRYEFDVIDRFGTGDAFLAGLVYSYLDTGDVEHALNFGNAACALAHTVEGDVAHISAAEVTALLGESIDLRVRR